jgi:hypothetical protein
MEILKTLPSFVGNARHREHPEPGIVAQEFHKAVPGQIPTFSAMAYQIGRDFSDRQHDLHLHGQLAIAIAFARAAQCPVYALPYPGTGDALVRVDPNDTLDVVHGPYVKPVEL